MTPVGIRKSRIAQERKARQPQINSQVWRLRVVDIHYLKEFHKNSLVMLQKLLRDRVGDISGDIVVQGSRAKGTAKPTSDIDIALRVSGDKFDSLINQYFKTPNPGSAKERTMLHAIETGKIQAGEAKLNWFAKRITRNFWNGSRYFDN